MTSRVSEFCQESSICLCNILLCFERIYSIAVVSPIRHEPVSEHISFDGLDFVVFIHILICNDHINRIDVVCAYPFFRRDASVEEEICQITKGQLRSECAIGVLEVNHSIRHAYFVLVGCFELVFGNHLSHVHHISLLALFDGLDIGFLSTYSSVVIFPRQQRIFECCDGFIDETCLVLGNKFMFGEIIRVVCFSGIVVVAWYADVSIGAFGIVLHIHLFIAVVLRPQS